MSRTAPTDTTSSDPVVIRRLQIERWSDLGKRVGYLLILVACVGFVWGYVDEFNTLTTTLVTVGLLGSCLVMPLPIVLAYGVKAANREERAAQAAKGSSTRAN